MKLRELVAQLQQGLDQDKEVSILLASQDPVYFDSADTVANQVVIVCDEYGTIQGYGETDADNNIIRNTLNE